MDTSVSWVPLMEYAIENDVSLSTLRRHIKAGKIPYKVEEGRYMLPAGGATPATFSTSETELRARVAELTRALVCAHEEIAELKTLIAYYEERVSGVRLDV